jgi:hypothetical protein
MCAGVIVLLTPESGGGTEQMYTPLQSHANLDDAKKEARKLLHALERGDPAALRRYYSMDPLAGLSMPRLEDALYIIAREHGYSSWRKLVLHAHVSPSISRSLKQARPRSIVRCS